MARKNTGQKTGNRKGPEESAAVDTSDKALTDLLRRLKTAANSDEIRQLSNPIERAVFHKQFATESGANLKKRLTQGALANADLNLEIAEEWFPVEQEAWNRLEQDEQAAKTIRSAGKSKPRIT